VYYEPGTLARTDARAAWLSASESARACAFTIDRRRRDWLRGRHAAKHACAAAMRERWGAPPSLVQLEIAAGASGAPFARLAPDAAPFLGFAPGEPLPVAVSISHRAEAAFCAAAPAEEVGGRLGADLERVEARDPSFVGDFFGEDEAAACRSATDCDLRTTAVWSAKEAVLKALGFGLTVDTRTVVCIPDDRPAPEGEDWRTFHIRRLPAGRHAPLAGVWRARGGFVQAIAYGVGRRRPGSDT
jgi:4'-phosphopantetheinyl transferase